MADQDVDDLVEVLEVLNVDLGHPPLRKIMEADLKALINVATDRSPRFHVRLNTHQQSRVEALCLTIGRVYRDVIKGGSERHRPGCVEDPEGWRAVGVAEAPARSMCSGEATGQRTVRMILGRRTGEHGAPSRSESMDWPIREDAPLPFTLWLGRREPYPVVGSAVPEHWAPKLLSTGMGECDPGIDVGVRVGDVWTVETDVDFTPLRRSLLRHSGRLYAGSEAGTTDLASPTLAVSMTFTRIQGRPIDPTISPVGPSSFPAKQAPGKFRRTESRHFRHLTYFDFPAEKVSLGLDHQRRVGRPAVSPEESQRHGPLLDDVDNVAYLLTDRIDRSPGDVPTFRALAHTGDERMGVPVPVRCAEAGERRNECDPAAVCHVLSKGDQIRDATVSQQLGRPRQRGARKQDVALQGVAR